MFYYFCILETFVSAAEDSFFFYLYFSVFVLTISYQVVVFFSLSLIKYSR